MPPRATTELYAANKVRTAATVAAVRTVWHRIDPEGPWDAQWARLVLDAALIVSAAQLGAAIDGASSVPEGLAQSGFPEAQLAEVDPRGFVGWMQHDDGLMIGMSDALLVAPIVRSRESAGDEPVRLAAGGAVLDALVQTAVADAARHAATAQGAATSRTANVFYDPPPMCQRCAVIVGRRYRWGTQFARHPRCDGQTQIVSEREQLEFGFIGPEDITDLTRAQQQAIADGADLFQVVNAKSGTIGGRTPTSALTDGGTRTYADRSRKRSSTRLTPKGVYEAAGDDRQRAIDLLRENGYIIR